MNASVIQRDADAAILVAHRDHLDVATDADAARLVDALTEKVAGRKADEANVKERTVALKAEFAALVIPELQRVDKKHASKFAKLTAAANMMHAETEDAGAEQQCRADSLAEVMLRQTNYQQTAYETMRFEVQRTVEQLIQSDLERRADAERLPGQVVEEAARGRVCRPAHDGGRDRRVAATHRIVSARSTSSGATGRVRRQHTEFKNDGLAARTEMQ